MFWFVSSWHRPPSPPAGLSRCRPPSKHLLPLLHTTLRAHSSRADLAFSRCSAGLSNTAGALPGVLGVTFAGYLLDSTGSWALALFFPTAACQLLGLVVYSLFASSQRQDWE